MKQSDLNETVATCSSNLEVVDATLATVSDQVSAVSVVSPVEESQEVRTLNF